MGNGQRLQHLLRVRLAPLPRLLLVHLGLLGVPSKVNALLGGRNLRTRGNAGIDAAQKRNGNRVPQWALAAAVMNRRCGLWGVPAPPARAGSAGSGGARWGPALQRGPSGRPPGRYASAERRLRQKQWLRLDSITLRSVTRTPARVNARQSITLETMHVVEAMCS